MKISGFKSIISSTYTDIMDIYRHVEVMNTDGTSGIQISQMPLYTGIKCRISFENRDASNTISEDTNPINLQIKIFCEPSVDIKKGDKLIVYRNDDNGNIMSSYEGIANLPFVYTTHKEIEITEIGDA